jgi:hypothetical protein
MNGLTMQELSLQQQSLEQRYLELTGELVDFRPVDDAGVAARSSGRS